MVNRGNQRQLQGGWAVKCRNKVLFTGPTGCHNAVFEFVIERHKGRDGNIIFYFTVLTMRRHWRNIWRHLPHQNVIVSGAKALSTGRNTVPSIMVKRPPCRQGPCRDVNPVHHRRKVIVRPGRGLFSQGCHLDVAAGMLQQRTGQRMF